MLIQPVTMFKNFENEIESNRGERLGLEKFFTVLLLGYLF